MNKLYNTRKFSCILFDMDGVIIDSKSCYIKAETSFFQEYGVSKNQIDWNMLHGCSEDFFYKYCKENLDINIATEILKSRCHSLIKEQFKKGVSFHKDFEKFYKSIPSNIQLGLVTSTTRPLFDAIDSMINLTSMFEIIITGSDVKYCKPNPEPYIKAMTAAIVSPKETLIIEDSLTGIAAAKASKAFVVAITGTHKAKELIFADQIIDSFSEININSLL